ncbi:unnamed protein product [Ceutorhynchus assimilis]|uniref:Protein prenyltransferase alpha subunit repeat-containing protein 1 n=1 Tax=Ceutorhynchus assimilis TaxID=467358 RepID=A0A9N9QPJ0_9CUCU|nr:unnamed protein product [Ceutorhynchus assimilis]
MEHASMSEKILRTIETTIKNDSLLSDFTIIPVANNAENRSPVLYENHHFGLESWCVRYIYDYACSKLFEARRSLAQKKISFSLKDDLNYLIVGALLINPDVPTFWNMKRELVEDNVLSLEEELTFSRLVLTHKPKSNEVFSYRRWLINRKLFKPLLPSAEIILMHELYVCTQTAENTPNNYHSWIHRQWVVTKFYKYISNLITAELDMNKFWISRHISESCGYHYRQFLLNQLKLHNNLLSLNIKFYLKNVLWHFRIQHCDDPEHFLIYLLGEPAKNNTIKDLSRFTHYVIYIFKELSYTMNIDVMNQVHEPYWLHRRYILHELLEASHKYLGQEFSPGQNLNTIQLNKTESIMNNIDCEEKQPKIFKTQPSESQWTSSNMFRIMGIVEKDFIEANIRAGGVQCEYANKHKRWLKYMMKFEIR